MTAKVIHILPLPVLSSFLDYFSGDLVCRHCDLGDPGFTPGGKCCKDKLVDCAGEDGCCDLISKQVPCQNGEGNCIYDYNCAGTRHLFVIEPTIKYFTQET